MHVDREATRASSNNDLARAAAQRLARDVPGGGRSAGGRASAARGAGQKPQAESAREPGVRAGAAASVLVARPDCGPQPPGIPKKSRANLLAPDHLFVAGPRRPSSPLD